MSFPRIPVTLLLLLFNDIIKAPLGPPVVDEARSDTARLS